MKSNSTWRGMIALGMRYHVYCDPCERDVEIDMTQLPPDGNAMNRSWLCKICGRRGHVIVSPRSVE